MLQEQNQSQRFERNDSKWFNSPVFVHKGNIPYIHQHIIDEFIRENKGRVLAEMELKRIIQQFSIPAWIDKEVSEDPRFFNVNLVKSPFRQWHHI